MSVFLALGSILSFLFGALQFLVAQSVSQQITAMSFLIISAVLFSGAAIVGKLSDVRSTLRHLLGSKILFPDGTPDPSFLTAVSRSLGVTQANHEAPPVPTATPEQKPAPKSWVEQAREETKSTEK